ncbi:hypothetical protein BDR26DRAFT_865790 [Obelidium mucronatum]|nr:hypothetical protein BDR26DRAFT_865790 [Obelidium mucronatum]
MLRALVGNHVGLLYASVTELNGRNKSQAATGRGIQTCAEVVAAIWSRRMYDVLKQTRAVQILEHTNVSELRDALLEDKNLPMFVKQGVLVESDGQYAFSSNIMFRFFEEKLCGERGFRASVPPRNLTEMVVQALRSINYGTHLAELLEQELSWNAPGRWSSTKQQNKQLLQILLYHQMWGSGLEIPDSSTSLFTRKGN